MATATKYVLITGANKGIGFATAQGLAKKGFHVIIGARDPVKGKKAVDEIIKAKGKASLLQIDVSDEKSVKAAAVSINKQIPHLDVLINNAGILIDMGANILKLEEKTMQQTMQTNLYGPLRVTQAFYPLLKKAPSARVINISSSGGKLTRNDIAPGFSPAYCISKTAVNRLTQELAGQFVNDGIVVNSMCPGWCKTDLGSKGAPRTVEQGADTAIWLATDAPKTINGKFLTDRKVIDW